MQNKQTPSYSRKNSGDKLPQTQRELISLMLKLATTYAPIYLREDQGVFGPDDVVQEAMMSLLKHVFQRKDGAWWLKVGKTSVRNLDAFIKCHLGWRKDDLIRKFRQSASDRMKMFSEQIKPQPAAPDEVIEAKQTLKRLSASDRKTLFKATLERRASTPAAERKRISRLRKKLGEHIR